jgi:hypothetical protein
VPTTESLHVTDAFVGVSCGTVAAGGAWLLRRAPPAALLAVAGGAIAAMVIAVGTGLVGDVRAGAAVAGSAAAAIAAVGLTRLAAELPRWAVAVIVFVTAGGVWLAVPDTEAAVACAAALAPAVLLVVAVRDTDIAAPGPGRPVVGWFALGWFAVAMAPAWAAVWGSAGRSASLPGALACFGVALAGALVLPTVHGRALAWIGAQAVTVVLSARWAARAPTVATGTLRAAAVLGLLAAVWFVSARSRGRALPPRYGRRARPR